MFKKSKSWETSICDFGLATYADEEKYLFVRCGTPGFVAPEIINIRDMSTKSDPISDVFSAGVIFHYLLFGCSVFEGKKYNEILTQNRACDFSFTKECYSELPSKTLDLLVKMLERDPLKRITSEAALTHPFFATEMDIEVEAKQPLASEIKSPSNRSKQAETAVGSGKGERSLFDFAKRDVRPYYYS
jgi:serine/threonine protein kinase